MVTELLGQAFKGTIQTDGYRVYADYAKNLPECTHALCWAHSRRAFLKAEKQEPEAVAQALEMIRALYRIERELREAGADQAMILERRRRESEPIVTQFFEWVDQKINDPSLLPKSLFAKALGYVAGRREGLRVFLNDAWLALDTNDLERALRVISMGRKN